MKKVTLITTTEGAYKLESIADDEILATTNCGKEVNIAYEDIVRVETYDA